MNKTTKIFLLIGGAIALLFASKKGTDAAVKYVKNMNKKDFVLYLLPIAKEVGASIGVPYMFIVAQICLETRFGLSSLWQKYFNPGGIKARPGEKFISLPTKEYINGEMKTVNQNFAVYPDAKAGIIGYSKILTNKYFKKYSNKTTNPNTYVRLLQSDKPKYATDPDYIKKIDNLLIEINKILLTE